ncbi:Hypothetical protein NTJ_05172 [Nesidiocoris tenuis]|uniref:Uncharacterized protein n=1 Tax=Nesidiocoris tenuis TaxID=355587 RepID=A0ABN7AK80_9HEMI|nr:Hypothetical protein NTJ_05172 [Nesidiocoris tenuis]
MRIRSFDASRSSLRTGRWAGTFQDSTAEEQDEEGEREKTGGPAGISHSESLPSDRSSLVRLEADVTGLRDIAMRSRLSASNDAGHFSRCKGGGVERRHFP